MDTKLDPLARALDIWSTFFVHPRKQTVTVYQGMIQQLIDAILEMPNTGDQLHGMLDLLEMLKEQAPVEVDQNSALNRKLMGAFLEQREYYDTWGRQLLMRLLLHISLV